MKGTIEIQVLKEANPEIKLAIATPVDPKEYYKTGNGLYVWSGFTTRILPKAKQIDADTAFTLESLDLVQDSTDEQIEKSLGNKNTFDESDVCAIIADLIAKQPKGEEGILLNNGYANIFYTPSCVVGVVWDDGEWYVGGWGRRGSEWGAGARVFSPQLALDL